MIITLVRHGKTAGNLEHRYIGRTDEPLCDLGKAMLQDQKKEMTSLLINGHMIFPEQLFVSPMKRCLETAGILYEDMPEDAVHIIPDFRESDFGHFEGKNYQDLDGDPEYQEWLDRNCDGQIPGGEHLDGFRNRCQDAFRSVLNANRDLEQIGIVAHGGVIMVLLEAFHKEHHPFHEYHMNNGACYICEWDGNEKLELDILERKG